METLLILVPCFLRVYAAALDRSAGISGEPKRQIIFSHLLIAKIKKTEFCCSFATSYDHMFIVCCVPIHSPHIMILYDDTHGARTPVCICSEYLSSANQSICYAAG